MRDVSTQITKYIDDQSNIQKEFLKLMNSAVGQMERFRKYNLSLSYNPNIVETNNTMIKNEQEQHQFGEESNPQITQDVRKHGSPGVSFINNFLTKDNEANQMSRQRSKIQEEFKEPIPRKNSISPTQMQQFMQFNRANGKSFDHTYKMQAKPPSNKSAQSNDNMKLIQDPNKKQGFRLYLEVDDTDYNRHKLDSSFDQFIKNNQFKMQQ